MTLRRQIAKVAAAAFTLFLAAQFAPFATSGLYAFALYGSLPWSAPWFQHPGLLCLSSCDESAIILMAYLGGFMLNAILLHLIVGWVISLFRQRQQPNHRDPEARAYDP